jgi:uncharacterized protein (DUF1499 family)
VPRLSPVLLIGFAASLAACTSVQQPEYGISAGALYPCPSSRACVSSQESDAARKVEPLKFTSEWRDARADLIAAINTFAGVRIVSSHRNYLRAEFPSKAMKNNDGNEFYFAARMGMDDLEFYFDQSEHVIHMRSASRLGLLDLGENRERVEALRKSFDAFQAKRAAQTPR